jgi:hypothetical protein
MPIKVNFCVHSDSVLDDELFQWYSKIFKKIDDRINDVSNKNEK